MLNTKRPVRYPVMYILVLSSFHLLPNLASASLRDGRKRGFWESTQMAKSFLSFPMTPNMHWKRYVSTTLSHSHLHYFNSQTYYRECFLYQYVISRQNRLWDYSNYMSEMQKVAMNNCMKSSSSHYQGGGDQGDGGQWPGVPASGDQVPLPDQNFPVHLQWQEGGRLPHSRAYSGGEICLSVCICA